MNINNTVVTVVSMMGEVVGELKDETDTTITLKKPRLFVPDQGNNGGGFAPGASMTGAQELDEAVFNKSVVLTIIPTHEAVTKGWIEYTSSIIV